MEDYRLALSLAAIQHQFPLGCTFRKSKSRVLVSTEKVAKES